MAVPFEIHSTSLDPGTLLLEASAGTGKTWSLTSIAVRLILEGRVDSIERLLLVTYTNKATDELRQRLRRRLREAERAVRGEEFDDPFLTALREKWEGDEEALRGLSRARRDVDLARVRTIHAFCQDILAEGAFEAGLPLDGAAQVEGDLLLRTAWRDTIRDALLSDTPFFAAAIGAFGIDPEDLSLLRTAQRRHDHRWRPEARSFEEIAGELGETVAAFEFGLLADFVSGDPGKDWRTADRNACLRAFELLGRGYDGDRKDHQLALFDLAAAKVEAALKQKGQKRLAGSEVEAMLARLEAPLSASFQSLQQELLRRALARYESLKERHALVDFDDIISRTRARLADESAGPALARRIGGAFDAALVDEFQDTDAHQWEIFRRLFTGPDHLLVLVGDPKQAIFRFRGADIYAYLEARKAADRVETLTRNFRSTPGLVEAVNAMFGAAPDQSFALDGIRFDPVEPALGADPANPAPMHFVWVGGGAAASQGAAESAVLRQLASDVVRRRREVPPGTGRKLAVLVRAHHQARAVMQALREVGVDAILAKGGDIHDTEAMGEWRVVLRALLDPSKLRMQRRARATRLWGATLATLDDGETTLEEVELFARLHRTWADEGVAAMATELLARRETTRRWLGETDGERLVTDLRHGLELLNRAEVERGLGPEALVRWAEAEALSAAPESDEERLLRLDRESEAVEVMTNFTSKGLEFDTVYLPFVWEPRLLKMEPPLEVHDPKTGEAVLDFAASAELQPQAWLEEMASRLRMHYVELTRAKERCVVYLAPVKRCFPQSAPAFLLARADAPAPPERGPWVRDEVDAISGGIDAVRTRVEGRLSVPSIEMRDAAGDTEASIVEEPPAVRSPEPLVFPPARLGALEPARQLSYTALVHALHERAPVDLPVADRADPADAPATKHATGIFGFARGARAGLCLHDVLEHADFSRAPDDDDRERVQAILVRHGLELPAAHPGGIDPVPVCLQLVERVGQERLPFGERSFAALDPAARFNEWEFHLPVDGLVPARIATLVAEHWVDEAWIGSAAARMARLSRQKLRGMMRGIVDLLFVDTGRWTVLDWKSNDLGPSVVDYSQAAMRRAMVEHDYVVQALLYLVAAQRYLRTRIRDYDYDRHLCGASYVFLRGLCGDPDTGWCNLRPPRTLIDALDALLDGGER